MARLHSKNHKCFLYSSILINSYKRGSGIPEPLLVFVLYHNIRGKETLRKIPVRQNYALETEQHGIVLCLSLVSYGIIL